MRVFSPCARYSVLAALAAVAGAGCGGKPQEKPAVEVLIQVEGDPGHALKGANVVFGGKTIATTDATGSARLTLNGNEGDNYDVNIRCPSGFQSPSKPLSIPLRRLADPSKTPEYEVSCPPTTRTIVVAVRAENGGNLPVMYLGRGGIL